MSDFGWDLSDFLTGTVVGLVAQGNAFLFYATVSFDSDVDFAANDNDWRPLRDDA